MPREDLEGHVGLTDRELYELGRTLAPLRIGDLGVQAARRISDPYTD